MPFSGDKGTCAKCGWTGAAVEYVGPAQQQTVCGDRWTVDAEFLLRVCECCRYEWLEACLDAAPVTEDRVDTGRCTSMNLGDQCQNEDGHMGNHVHLRRQWSDAPGAM